VLLAVHAAPVLQLYASGMAAGLVETIRQQEVVSQLPLLLLLLLLLQVGAVEEVAAEALLEMVERRLHR
jgi:hypothetical protein